MDYRTRMDSRTRLEVKYTIVSPYWQTAYLPKYASVGSAGMDLHACIPTPISLSPGQRIRIPTGLAIQLPDAGAVGLIYARSGLALRHGLGLPNGVGVIDSDYTGELQVLLMNYGELNVEVSPGDRIAQLVLTPVFFADWTAVDSLTETERGNQGFGSTGV
jgi:dUTP pyrophosphatase